MKALILAAGFGTRLLPYTTITPKCLFPIDGRPLLNSIIYNLHKAGCRELIINTHHLSHKIDSYIAGQGYPIPVHTRFEPVVLGTGGAIKNVADFWGDEPFMVINSDIVTDIPLKAVYAFHTRHPFAATLALYDDDEFNTVSVDANGFITSFDGHARVLSANTRQLAFTGIQVLDPEVLTLIPKNKFSSSIEMYRKLLSSGKKIKAFIPEKYTWKDIGTPDRYRQTVLSKMAPKAFQRAFPGQSFNQIDSTPLCGDGSDRKWYRLTAGPHTLVLADHGLRKQESFCEVDSYVAIGRYLFNTAIPVPEMFLYDTFCGLIFLEDLGDINLESIIRGSNSKDEILSHYRAVIDILVNMSVRGLITFNRSWAYQTPEYNRMLIIEKECRYFVDAFLNAYRNLQVNFEDLKDEFSTLADKALKFSTNGFMHRDLQSRNIMVRKGRYYLIDFQGGRIGPIQYDLASLLIDPYVELSDAIQGQLVDYCIQRLSTLGSVNRHTFYEGYRYCSLSRNLQILGAFAHLSRHKGKIYFEQFIPAAIKTLKYNLCDVPEAEFSRLNEIACGL